MYDEINLHNNYITNSNKTMNNLDITVIICAAHFDVQGLFTAKVIALKTKKKHLPQGWIMRAPASADHLHRSLHLNLMSWVYQDKFRQQ